MSAAPTIPTVGETVKGYEVTSWYGILAPAKTPRAIVTRPSSIQRWSVARKREVVLRLMRGESAELLSRGFCQRSRQT